MATLERKRTTCPKLTEWLARNTKISMNAEQAQIENSHPRVQQIHSALQLLSEVAKDYAWVRENDLNGKLERALEILIQLTQVKSG